MPLIKFDQLPLYNMQDEDGVLDNHIQNIPYDHASNSKYFSYV